MLKAILFLASLSWTWASRGELKVHKIILNQEKYSRCETTRIQQVVAFPGYEPTTIDNHVCVGWCYSYSIPSTQPAEPGEVIGPYCDSCQPVETKCYHVVLRSDGKDPDAPKTFQKRVQIIKKCSCMSCETVQKEDCEINGGTTVELPKDLFYNSSEDTRSAADIVRMLNDTQELVEEVPELLHFPTHKRPHPQLLNLDLSATNEQRYELNSKLINLLRSIQNEGDGTNLSYDKNQLKELLKIIEGSENDLSDKNLMEFVNFVNIHNSEDLELDLSRLKDVLTTFQKHQHILEKHRDFGLTQGQINSAKIEQDLKKYDLPQSFGLEEPERHHLGDEVHMGLNVGHLVKGPHGSMVLNPDLKVEEKLNIDSDVLKPNHDGVVIAYESPVKGNGILTD